MTLNRKVLKRVHSPLKSPKRNNTSLRKKALIKQLSGDVQFGAASKANLKVVVRVRPQNKYEEENNARCIVKVVDDHMLVFDPKEDDDEFFFRGVRQRARDLSKRQNREQKFAFERVFNENSTNEEVYEATVQDIIDTVLSGYNCSVFAYGATGAGKTFTMLGKKNYPGITFLTLMELYRRIDEIKDEKTCEVGISYIEVYNEMVRDLLKPGKPLNVQEDGRQILIPGLSLHKPENAEELMQMLSQGNQNRTQHPTDANAESSRSHAVFQVFVRQQDRVGNIKSNVSIAKLSMIDLAGSERGAATGFRGARFREGASINKSLLALGNCINALADGQRHIPYRDSKLTRLLKDSIGGNCRSVMIATVSPASTTFEDTFNTLRYANRAKTIKTTIKKNIMNIDQHVSNYVKIVEDLRQEICSLKEKVNQYEQKEKEWEAEKEALVAVTSQPSQASPLKNADYEEKIASLEKQLQERSPLLTVPEVEPSVTREAEVQQRLIDASHEQKSLRRELLQLESSQREMEFKMHICNARLNRMKIIAFASKRLDKSISRCERTIRNLQIRLSQTKKLQDSVQMKLSTNFAKLQLIQAELNQWGPDSKHPSKASQDLIEKSNGNLALRDLHQLSEYLRGLVKEGFSEQNASEQLICLLLTATRQFYLQLRVQDSCTPEMETLFKNILQDMDESKVIWADQQCVNDQKEVVNEKECSIPQLDVSHFTVLPISSQIFMSPVSQDYRIFRKSNLKSSIGSSQLPGVDLHSTFAQTELESTSSALTSVPEAGQCTTPVTVSRLTAPESSVLSMFSSEKQRKWTSGQLPVITTGSLHKTSHVLIQSGDTHTISPMQIGHSSRGPSSDNKENETTPLRFVSMVKGSGIESIYETLDSVIASDCRLNTTELLQDPVKCSVNRTFATSPKAVSTQVDISGIAPNLNVTIDVPSKFDISKAKSDAPISSWAVNATTELPVNYGGFHSVKNIPQQPTSDSVPVDESLLINTLVSKETSSSSTRTNLCMSDNKQMHNTTITLLGQNSKSSQNGINIEMTKMLDPVMPITDLHSVAQGNLEAASQPLGTIKTSRMLFKSSALDSTFSIEELKAKEYRNVSELSPGCTSLGMESPGNCNGQGRQVLDSLHRPPLMSVENKKPLLNIPVTITTDTLGTDMIPPSKEYKGSLKRPFRPSPQKGPSSVNTPGKEMLLKKNLTPGKTQHSGNKSGLAFKRSVSTPCLTPSKMSTSKSAKSMYNVKNKSTGFGKALHRTTSFLRPKPQVGNNHDDGPPSTRKVLPQSASLMGRKDAVLTSAKHSSNNL
ncbi:uncharacterized protein [Procambarus clarkii]|nr:kinesin-like protein KIN-5B isoform X2 [Procambarus clarkii]